MPIDCGSGSNKSSENLVRASPARISFRLTGREQERVAVGIYYSEPRSEVESLVKLAGGANNPMELNASRPYEFDWPFQDQVSSGAGYAEGFTVMVRAGESSTFVLASLGNDPPEIKVTPFPGDEAVRIAALDLQVSDSSEDLVSIAVEYSRGEGGPWSPATPAGQPTTEAIKASKTGKPVSFFWDVIEDLGRTEEVVKLRFTPSDDLKKGVGVKTQFRVDNDELPKVEIDVKSFAENPDRRRGIPIPFTVWPDLTSQGAETQEVLVVFQWRLSSQSFDEPRLDLHDLSRRSEIEAILADPVKRRERQIATEHPPVFEGLVLPVSPKEARLPEMASSAAGLLALGMEGRELEILRPENAFERAGEGWDLNSPIAALPAGKVLPAFRRGWSACKVGKLGGRKNRRPARLPIFPWRWRGFL
ncbi:MAG: hypothetical protein HY717_13140 [Planctomycetes bacterium]|nr:hypothetical protein [Planctomycetota bacterium]